ncbi:uncharacterized protein N7515_004670 [Penicillium bovifimosum]|uniref:SET domain-containing protein n=1 Tax=Penicillium bovifimosum TaxID=126998 RepID=A0A9W9L442_9EURO|nr:uncharacterized protein N7515_004670 [Penicillium bovifimosum]KAJ5135392.1 hypothetical protein N7515_004670 [Penicillium bovifimosum]
MFGAGRFERLAQATSTVREHSGTQLTGGTVMNFAGEIDVNCLKLQTPFYDRIGLYLHPYASLINHSCDYNSAIGFDTQELYVKATRPIKKGQQIFISYIDATTPRYVRRKELKELYFFDCHCRKCIQGVDTLEDRFLSPPSDKATIITASQEALELRRITLAPGTNPADRIQKLEAAMRRLRATGVWPLTRQPYPSLRDDLIVHAREGNRLYLAFIHAAIRVVRIDPQMYERTDPIRLLHIWTLAEIIRKFSEHVESTLSDPKDPVRVRDWDINFSLIMWEILANIIGVESMSPTVPTFRRVVELHLAVHHDAYKANGFDLTENRPILAFEWSKLEGLVDKALEKE